MRFDDATLRDVIERNARRYGGQMAYVCDGRSVTHRQFLEQAKVIASALYGLGVRSQDRVSVLSMNSLEFALIYGACEAFGIVTATVNFRLAPAEMVHIIGDPMSEVLIFEAAYAGHIEQIRDRLPHIKYYVAIGETPSWAMSWEAFLATGDPDGPPLTRPKADDLAYLIYTSGTTGRPKGCMLDHAAEVATAEVISRHMGLGAEDRTLLMMPLFHIGAKAIALAQQYVGGAVILHRKFDATDVLRTVQKERVTATHMAPTLIQGLVEAPDRSDYDLSTLRTLLYSAAAMPPSLLRRALEVFGPIFQQMYGQTEGIGTVLPIGAHKPDGDAMDQRRLNSVGHAFIGCEVAILDDEDRALPFETVGEICIRGPIMMRGYWNESAATQSALSGGWLHTGDVGVMDEDGYIYLVDRKKDVIISGGENIYSREVEDAILQHPAVLSAAVIAAADPKWGETVCAVVVLRPGQGLTEDELVEHCRGLIAAYKRPRRVVFVEELPVLASGKINKPALREIHGRNTEA
jgi:acyl-CoA synthetase (AMP-forming)/AMP-acid ligase II